MFKGFREFVLRGNVVDLAIGVVIGAAFGTVVNALVKDLLTPIIAAIAGKPDFSGFYFEANGAKFLYGDFINAIIAFLLIAASGVLLCGTAGERVDEALREAGASRQEEVPGVPERHSDRRPQVRLLHVGACLAAIGVLSLSPGSFGKTCVQISTNSLSFSLNCLPAGSKRQRP